MSLVEVVYKRGNTFVQNKYKVKDFVKDSEGKILRDEHGKKKWVFRLDEKGNPIVDTAHGLVGELWVRGLQFETIERMDGYMKMAGDKTYAPSAMYHDKNYGYVINPSLGDAEKTQGNILFHPVGTASGLEGCVGVGFFDQNGNLADGSWCMQVIYEQIGGKAGEKKKVDLILKVEGQMKALTSCAPWTYSA